MRLAGTSEAIAPCWCLWCSVRAREHWHQGHGLSDPVSRSLIESFRPRTLVYSTNDSDNVLALWIRLLGR